MISTILGAFRVGEIRNKVLFTALMLGLYRLGTHIPAPDRDLRARDHALHHGIDHPAAADGRRPVA